MVDQLCMHCYIRGTKQRIMQEHLILKHSGLWDMTVSLDERFEAFLRTIVPSSSGIFPDCLGIENEAP